VVSGKKLKDYRVEEYIDDRGRVRTRSVYVGGDYTLDPPVPERGKRFAVLASAASWVLYAAALILPLQTARVVYVVLPFAFSALPMFLMTGAAVSLARSKDVLERVVAAKIANRLAPGALFVSVFAGAAFISGVITAAVSWGGVSWGDVVFSASALLLSSLNAVVYARFRKMKAVTN
jgi:multisubunit Na+/H+ antiporter MnhG subunit